MNLKETAKKLKSIDYGAFFGSKAFLIGGCIVIIVAAIIVNALIPTGSGTKDGEVNILGNSVLVDATLSGDADADADAEGADYFTQAVVERENTRNEAMEVLQTIADNPDALADAKEQAMEGIAAIADEMNAETTIEQLVKAKGFSRCVCIVSSGRASVVVSADEELTQAQVAQILEIVYMETGILPAETKVSAMKSA